LDGLLHGTLSRTIGDGKVHAPFCGHLV
jgi:hypothetical protein